MLTPRWVYPVPNHSALPHRNILVLLAILALLIPISIYTVYFSMAQVHKFDLYFYFSASRDYINISWSLQKGLLIITVVYHSYKYKIVKLLLHHTLSITMIICYVIQVTLQHFLVVIPLAVYDSYDSYDSYDLCPGFRRFPPSRPKRLSQSANLWSGRFSIRKLQYNDEHIYYVIQLCQSVFCRVSIFCILSLCW